MGILVSTLSNIPYIGMVVLGLGFVIFIHELGHFLMAKWNDVHVEMFALGFGKPIFTFRKGIGFRWGLLGRTLYRVRVEETEANGQSPVSLGFGETEYSIRWVPLGGFVKMLGGDDSDLEKVETADPRAFPNKPVGSRMAIISAGVIMNFLSGLIFFILAYGRGGLPVVPARVGAVLAGHPAYSAGLRTGDEIVAVDGRRDIDFQTVKRLTAMSSPGHVLHLDVKRPGFDGAFTVPVEPRRMGSAEMKAMGFLPISDTVLAPKPIEASFGLPDPSDSLLALRDGDRIVAIGPEDQEPMKVASQFDLDAALTRWRNQPLRVVVERKESGSKDKHTKRIEATLPVVHFVDFGFVLTPGPVAALRPDGPAKKAGARIDDRIVSIDGDEAIDPLRLPDLINRHAGQEITVTVSRSEGGKPPENVSLKVVPDDSPTWIEPVLDKPLDIPGLGLAIEVEPKIKSVKPGSPAELAGLKPGDVLTSVIASSTSDKHGKPETSETLTFGAKGDISFPMAFYMLQFEPPQDVTFALADGRTVSLRPEPDASWTNPMHGLSAESFLIYQKPAPPLAPGASVRRGLEEAFDWVGSMFALFRNLISGDISPKAVGGPVTIASAAWQHAQAGFSAFLSFLGLLSINLAVLNFLPIPPLDGGQMVYLIAEKVRGRPLPEKALNFGLTIGIVLVLGLMAFVLYNEIIRFVWPWIESLLRALHLIH